MFTVQPFTYHGTIRAPRSKSYLQRAIAIATLLEKPVKLNGFYPSNDVLAAIDISQTLGAEISIHDESVIIHGGAEELDKVSIHCGESGLSSRMFSPIAAALADEVTVNGDGSLLNRPMDMIIDALEKLGARVSSKKGKLPLQISRGLHAGEIHIDASESSQLLTGILIALSFIEGESVIHVANLSSKPYIDMTLDALHAFDIRVTHDDHKVFYVVGKISHHADTYTYDIEGDWSGAAFHLVGGAISGNIALTGLNLSSPQADRSVLDVLQLAGAKVETKEDAIIVQKDQLNAFKFDASDCPDLFPPLAALAAACEGTSKISGVSRLRYKESDRAITIQEELKKLGIKVTLDGNTMLIRGGEVKGGTISSRNDHRIAMMGAILTSVSAGPITIEGHEAVNKSYPTFFYDLLN